ncbi:GlcNAc-PI de-N-acetylase OS=Streptomyces antimycoticus OX=68175 GN=SSPO_079580 PE=4 SV=1 [Streptomyces antimycoticus]
MDGDLGRLAAYQPLSPEIAEQKVRLLQEQLPRSGTSDQGGLPRPCRIRRIECHAPYAEAFAVAELTLNLGG